MRGPITQEQMEASLHYLWSTDEPCAALRADMARTEWKAKRVKQTIFKLSTGSVAERTATADIAPETDLAYEEHFKAMEKYHAMNDRRATEMICFEAWRSLNSNRRQAS